MAFGTGRFIDLTCGPLVWPKALDVAALASLQFLTIAKLTFVQKKFNCLFRPVLLATVHRRSLFTVAWSPEQIRWLNNVRRVWSYYDDSLFDDVWLQLTVIPVVCLKTPFPFVVQVPRREVPKTPLKTWGILIRKAGCIAATLFMSSPGPG